MKSGEFQSQNLIAELGNQLTLDQTIRQTAEHYLSEFKSQDLLWEDSKNKYAARCAILIAYKTSKRRTMIENEEPLSLSSLLLGPQPADTHTFIRKLKEFLKVVQIDERVNSDFQALINSYAFSLTLFNKFEAVWEKLQISCEESKKIKDFTWLVYILSRVNILQRRCEIVECACMLLGAFFLMLSLLPAGVSKCLPSESLGFLCNTIKAAPEQVKLAADHLKLMVEKLKEHNLLRGSQANSSNIEGILQQSHLGFNIKSLSTEYSSKILPDDIDERDFLLKETTIGSPLKIKDVAGMNSQRFCSKRVLDYEDDETLSMSSRLQDIKFPSLISNSPYSIKTFPPSSRMLTSLELETWLSSHTESISSSIPNEIIEKLDNFAYEFLKNLLDEFSTVISNAFDSLGIGKIQPTLFLKSCLQIPTGESKISSENILKLFQKVLLELLHNEEKQQELRSDSKEQMSNVLKNETFYRALLVCCIETTLFVNNITALEFSEVLEICKVSSFDTWKLMKNYLEFDSLIPTALRQHFKALESRVISNMAWADSSPVAAHIRMHLSSKKDLNHPAILMFCRRVLAYSALRIFDLSNLLSISEEIREEIWNVMKNALSEETDLFINREMDQVIICTMYGVCKAKNLNVTFNNLIAKYTEYYNDNGRLFRQVRIDQNSTGDIIRFYNEVYIKYMKTYLMPLSKGIVTSHRIEPRIPSLNPASPLRYSLPPPMISFSPSDSRHCLSSPLRSPYATPRTKRLYAFGESPSFHLDAINHMMNKTGVHLNFDDDKQGTPTKRAKIMDNMFEDSFEIEEDHMYGDNN